VAEQDAKVLYNANQIAKNFSPYAFDSEDGSFLGQDEQSEVVIRIADLHMEVPDGKRYAVFQDGPGLFKFLGEQKKGVKGALPFTLTRAGLRLDNEQVYTNVSYSNELPYQSRLSDSREEDLIELDCSQMKLFYDKELVKKDGFLIGDILDVIANKKQHVANEFVFLELIGKEVHIYESKIGLSLRNRTLICLNGFYDPKTKVKEKDEEFLKMYHGPERIYIHYGNPSMQVVHKFLLWDLHKVETKLKG
jgi:hypothetical protein